MRFKANIILKSDTNIKIPVTYRRNILSLPGTKRSQGFWMLEVVG